MILPKPGTPAPDFELANLNGEKVRLRHYPKPVHLTFLRHLA